METVRNFFMTVWYVLRQAKPVRTFWQTLAALLGVNAAAGAIPGLESVNWLTVMSGAALAGVVSFVSIMAGGDSFWSEKQEDATGGSHAEV